MPTREEIVKALRGEQVLVCFDPLSGKIRDPGYLTDMNRNSYILYGDAADLIEQQAEEIGEAERQLGEFSAFLCKMTGNRMSKTNYAAQEMISCANDYQQEICNGCPDIEELASYQQVKKALQDAGFESLEGLLEDYAQVKRERDASIADIEKLMSEVGLQCWEACEFCGMYDDDECIRNAPHKGQCKTKWRGAGDKPHVD